MLANAVWFSSVAIVGSRGYADRDFVEAAVESIRPYTDHIITTNNYGVENWAAKHARKFSFCTTVYMTERGNYGSKDAEILGQVKKDNGIVIAVGYPPADERMRRIIEKADRDRLPVAQCYGSFDRGDLLFHIGLLYNMYTLREWLTTYAQAVQETYPLYRN